jgi:Protein of unknown function (DUF559)
LLLGSPANVSDIFLHPVKYQVWLSGDPLVDSFHIAQFYRNLGNSSLISAIATLGWATTGYMAKTLPTPPFGHPSQAGRKPAKIIRYKPYLKKLAHKLRKNMTFGEVTLWQHLKRKQMQGYDFDSQRPIDGFIVDFYCKELMLAIEIDGNSHNSETRPTQRSDPSTAIRSPRCKIPTLSRRIRAPPNPGRPSLHQNLDSKPSP